LFQKLTDFHGQFFFILTFSENAAGFEITLSGHHYNLTICQIHA